MKDIIAPQQSAFVGGRLIQDNLVVAHEAFYYLKKKSNKGGKGIVIKLDMNKAYDRVSWAFLEKVLDAYGFDSSWVKSVTSLVYTVSYSYQVNGFASRELMPNRGLRQGDPPLPISVYFGV